MVDESPNLLEDTNDTNLDTEHDALCDSEENRLAVATSSSSSGGSNTGGRRGGRGGGGGGGSGSGGSGSGDGAGGAHDSDLEIEETQMDPFVARASKALPHAHRSLPRQEPAHNSRTMHRTSTVLAEDTEANPLDDNTAACRYPTPLRAVAVTHDAHARTATASRNSRPTRQTTDHDTLAQAARHDAGSTSFMEETHQHNAPPLFNTPAMPAPARPRRGTKPGNKSSRKHGVLAEETQAPFGERERELPPSIKSPEFGKRQGYLSPGQIQSQIQSPECGGGGGACVEETELSPSLLDESPAAYRPSRGHSDMMDSNLSVTSPTVSEVDTEKYQVQALDTFASTTITHWNINSHAPMKCHRCHHPDTVYLTFACCPCL